MACVSSFVYGMMIELIDLSKVVAGRQLHHHFASNYQEFGLMKVWLQHTKELGVWRDEYLDMKNSNSAVQSNWPTLWSFTYNYNNWERSCTKSIIKFQSPWYWIFWFLHSNDSRFEVLPFYCNPPSHILFRLGYESTKPLSWWNLASQFPNL